MMLNKKTIQSICFLLCIITCYTTLFGCTQDTTDYATTTYTKDITTIDDFKCICSTDGETEFVIENDDAKVLYTYIMEQWEKAEETEIDRTEQNCIYLSFQDGEPLLILSQEPKAEISDALAVSSEHFYGVFWIHENDYMIYTPMPIASFQKFYKMPNGTYSKIAEMTAE